MSDPMVTDRPIVAAVVGLGYWGPNLLRVLADDAGILVKWVCDLDPQRLVRLQRRYPAIEPTTDVKQILSDHAVDAVFIGCPGNKRYTVRPVGSAKVYWLNGLAKGDHKYADLNEIWKAAGGGAPRQP